MLCQKTDEIPCCAYYEPSYLKPEITLTAYKSHAVHWQKIENASI